MVIFTYSHFISQFDDMKLHYLLFYFILNKQHIRMKQEQRTVTNKIPHTRSKKIMLIFKNMILLIHTHFTSLLQSRTLFFLIKNTL